MKGQPKRDWTDAVAKRDREGVCRNCGDDWRQYPGRKLEFAHTAGREHDQPKPCPACLGSGELPHKLVERLSLPERWCPVCQSKGSLEPGVLWVNPDDGVPLCGPSTDTSTCHGLEHAHQLDLLPLLKLHEQLRVVELLGGVALAYKHTTFDEPERAAA